MHRLYLDNRAYLTAAPPSQAVIDALRMASAAAANGEPVHAYVWDGVIDGVRVRFGPKLDDMLLSQVDAGACCALDDERWGRAAAARGLGGALAILSRDADARIAVTEAPAGELRLFPGADGRPRPGPKPDRMSIVIPARGGEAAVARRLAALGEQEGVADAEILVLVSEPAEGGGRADEQIQAPDGLRVRRLVLAGDMHEATVVNAGVALASGEAVIVLDPRCAPASPGALSNLAAWAMADGVLTACPVIVDSAGDVLAAGMTADPRGAAARLWKDGALSRVVRRTLAPAPHLFALNRKAWLRAGGASGEGPLWTMALASAEGRHVLVGSETATWSGPEPLPGSGDWAASPGLSGEAVAAVSAVAASSDSSAAAPARTEDQDVPGPEAFTDRFDPAVRHRLLVFADGFGASQSIAFVQGLAASRLAGAAAVRVIDETALGVDGPAFHADYARALIRAALGETRPTAIVLSRFGHAAAYPLIREAAEQAGVPLAAHVDDDLFDLPPCLGIDRYRWGRHPRRILTLRRILNDADLVIASTPEVAERLAPFTARSAISVLDIGSAGSPSGRRTVKAPDAPLIIGYMGSASHNHDLEMIAPALNAILSRHDHVSIELFGSIADQPVADDLRGRVRRRKAVVGDYADFKTALADLHWDIGLAPLRPIAYNLCKTPTKWIEYAEAGIASVVSDLGVYRPVIAAGAALPARPDGWQAAISRLVTDAALRENMTARADALLLERYSWARLEKSMLAALSRLSPSALAA